MTIFERIAKYAKRVIGGFKKHHPEFEAALEAWGKQFLTEMGQLAEQAALNYGPKLLSGEMTIKEAQEAALADLKKQGVKKSGELADLVFNALRTLIPAL